MLAAALSLVLASPLRKTQVPHPQSTASTPVSQIPPLDDSNSIPFVLPWDDAVKGTATDVSFLNGGPITRRVVAKGPIFVKEGTDERVKFLAWNMGARAAFPEKSEADRIAARMAKMGVNLVRLHHLNNGWDTENGGSIWKVGRNWVEIDPAQLDKLDYFVAALAKRGIYTNMNLQVSRTYVPELGFPESVKEIGNFDKKIDKIDRRMIALQKAYAKDLLGRKNPYTGKLYKDDPAVAIVEINNENSLVGWPGEAPGAGQNALTGLPEPFRGNVVKLWNGWLLKKYGSDAKWRDAWSAKSDLGPSQTSRTSVWTDENQSNSDATYTVVPNTGAADAAPTFVAEVRKHDGPNWHLQAHVPGLTFEAGKTYTVSFRAKSSAPATVGVTANRDRPDWHNNGLSGSVTTGPEWKEYNLSFRAVDTEPKTSRVAFVLGDMRGKIEIADLKVRPGSAGVEIPAGAAPSLGTVDLPSYGFDPRGADWLDFLLETETAYTREMTDYVRKDLGFAQASVIDTQGQWGGLTSLRREAGSSYTDSHAYWNHPTFLGKDWDPVNYRVDRKPMVSALYDGSGATFNDLVLWRRADRPFSVSEYDHPAPSDYVSEMMPLLSTFAAFQDWDAIYPFAATPNGAGQVNDRIAGFFDTSNNPAVAAFYPAAALVLRQALVEPPAYRQTLVLGGEPWKESLLPQSFWAEAKTKPDFLHAEIAMRYTSEVTEPKVISTRAAPSRTIRMLGKSPEDAAYVATDDRALAATGFLDGKTVEASGMTFTFGRTTAGFASMMLVPLDSKPLSESKRMLLTAIGRAENTGMKWNAARDSVGDDWSTGPVRAETVPMALSLAGKATLYVLDPSGRRTKEFPLDATTGRGTIVLGTPNNAAKNSAPLPPFAPALPQGIWYEIVRN